MRHRWLMFFLMFAIMTIAYGCAKVANTANDIAASILPVKADNPVVNEFNKQLGEIKDEPTAEKAVNSFFNYVGSRIDKKTAGVTAQYLQTLIKPALIKDIAKQELAVRIGNISILSTGNDTEEKPLIDIGTITDNLNELGKDEGIKTDDESIVKAKIAVEESLPNLNQEKRSTMTPLEAMVIGYSAVSGDNGTAPPDSVKLPVDKVNTFIENITQ